MKLPRLNSIFTKRLFKRHNKHQHCTCECCCDCKDEHVSHITIDISFFPTYPNRICPIPVPAGALTNIGGNILNGYPWEANLYYLEISFQSCCKDFKNSTEFEELENAGTARATVPSVAHRPGPTT